jgi:hypothetical protein
VPLISFVHARHGAARTRLVDVGDLCGLSLVLGLARAILAWPIVLALA